MDRLNVPLLSRFLFGLKRHAIWGWVGLAAYAMIVTFPHENVQTLVANIIKATGRGHFYLFMAVCAIAGGTWLTTVVFLRLREQPERRIIFLYWMITMLLVMGTWGLLTVNNSELVHYPQYVPVGMALIALTGCAAESMAWVTLIGGLDECFQYWHLHGTWGVPYDFNDVYMDLLGGTAGVLVGAAFLHCSRREPGGFVRWFFKRPGIMIILAIAELGCLLRTFGLMLLYKDPANTRYWFALSRMPPKGFWFFNPGWGPNTIHTLSPIEGPVLILTTIGLFAMLDRRVRISTKP